MQFIIAIVLLAVFMSVAPKFFKWLLMIDISICIGWYIFLRVLAFIYDAGRGGANAGMFADDAVIFVLAAFAAPVIVVAGILVGALMSWARNR